MRRALTLCGLLGLLLLTTFPATAQGSKFELFGGYSYGRVLYDTNGTTSNANGGSMDVGFFPLAHWGVVGNIGGAYSSGFTRDGHFFSASSTTYHYEAGPRYRRGAGPISFYVQLLGGVVSRGNIVDSVPGDAGYLCEGCTIPFTFGHAGRTWVVTPSVGFDAQISKHFSIRIIQIGGQLTDFPSQDTSTAYQVNLVASSGLVFHFH